MYTGFWGLSALCLILLGHSGYVWLQETKGKEHGEIPGKVIFFLGGILGLILLGFSVSVVTILLQADSMISYVLGLLMLMLSFCFNSQLRRFIPYFIKTEEQEETENE